MSFNLPVRVFNIQDHQQHQHPLTYTRASRSILGSFTRSNKSFHCSHDTQQLCYQNNLKADTVRLWLQSLYLACCALITKKCHAYILKMHS